MAFIPIIPWSIEPINTQAWMQKVADKCQGYKMRNGRIVEVLFRE